jgi:hypothetical protein
VARTNLFVRGWGKHGQASLVRGTTENKMGRADERIF